jgi:4-amino-4-deoxy-L-arabinose transferase-like glycosyltransferase
MRGKRWGVVLACFLMSYGVFVATIGSGAAAGSDSSGYLNCARLLASGRLTTPARTVPGVPDTAVAARDLSPLGFKLSPKPGDLVTTYPIGLPLHLMVASWLFGWSAAGVAVNTVAAVASLLLLYLVARRLGLPGAWAMACVVLFAVFPVTVASFTWVMSDGLVTAWCLAAVYCTLRCGERRGWAIFAGAAFGIGVLVRPTSSLLLVALLLALPWTWRTLAAFATGVLPVAAVLGAYNAGAYGHIIATGYTTGPSRLALSYFGPRISHFASWISRFMTPVPLLLWTGGVYRCVRGDRRYLLLLAWWAPIVGFYAFYYNSIESVWFLRFILPALPPLIIGAALVGLDLFEWIGKRRWAAGRGRLLAAAPFVAVLLLAAGLSLGFSGKSKAWRVRAEKAVYPEALAWAAARVPPNSLLVCKQLSGSAYFYTPLPILRYDNVSKAAFVRLLPQAKKAGTPVVALVFDFELKALQDRLGQPFEEVARFGNVRLLLAPAGGALPPPSSGGNG